MHQDEDEPERVLVQEGAPHNFLLGTDLQPKLGFTMVAESETKMTNLLTGEEYVPPLPTPESKLKEQLPSNPEGDEDAIQRPYPNGADTPTKGDSLVITQP